MAKYAEETSGEADEDLKKELTYDNINRRLVPFLFI